MIERVEFPAAVPKGLTRAAAYVRVSSGKDAMLHSLSAQVNYYSRTIQNHPGWQYAGVYSDEAISGTKDERPGFQRLLQDCREGKVDIILTKSISRFARSTVTLLEVIREMKRLHVDVWFEEQNIHTMSGAGELLLTILASFAEEESRSVSDNMKWRVRKNFEEGKAWNPIIYGYRYVNGIFEIVPEEAAVIRRIYDMYLSGMGFTTIAETLQAEGVPKREYWKWSYFGVSFILKNVTYTGDLMLQKTYRPDFRTKVSVKNRGEVDMYYAENAHEAIIDRATFETVQREIRRRCNHERTLAVKYPFSKLLTCGICGARYQHKLRPGGNTWICTTYNHKGKQFCASKQVPETALVRATEEVVGSMDALDLVADISVESGNRLRFRLKDGREIEREWKDRSRSESWTGEMKEQARKRAVKQWSNKWVR